MADIIDMNKIYFLSRLMDRKLMIGDEFYLDGEDVLMRVVEIHEDGLPIINVAIEDESAGMQLKVKGIK